MAAGSKVRDSTAEISEASTAVLEAGAKGLVAMALWLVSPPPAVFSLEADASFALLLRKSGPVVRGMPARLFRV